jgi:hypothetical protein
MIAGCLLRLQAAAAYGCPSGMPLGTFELSVQNPTDEPALPVRIVNRVRPGQKLVYQPVRLPASIKARAKIALVLLPAGLPSTGNLTVLAPQPAAERAEWAVPYQTEVLGLVLGPQGLSVKKVSSLVEQDHEVMSQLADYAEQSTKVEALVEQLAAAEQAPDAGRALSATLSGLAGGSMAAKVDLNAPTDKQAMALLRGLNPALGAYDPLAPQPAARMQQSAGLAASVAGLFLGSPVGLAVGSAALLNNLRMLMFPDTDFRSALAGAAPGHAMTLCAKRADAKSKTRIAYLWALRIPNAPAPAVSFAGNPHAPLGVKWTVQVTVKEPGKWALLDRVQDWTLVSETDASAAPVAVKTIAQAHALEIDLSHFARPPGPYRLSGKWDWDRFYVPGALQLFAISSLKRARVAEESQDRLVAGSGAVAIQLLGDDFQFVKGVSAREADKPDARPVELKFSAPPAAGGPQTSLQVLVDTRALPAARYHLILKQQDDSVHEVPMRILPSNPALADLPLRANLGEARQKIALRGTGLDRIERIECENADVQLLPGQKPGTRAAEMRLHGKVEKGASLALLLHVEGLHSPVRVPDAVYVAGPRPRIAQVERSWSENLGISLRNGELPAGSFMSFSMRVNNLDSQPALRLECSESGKTLAVEILHPGARHAAARLDPVGQGGLFLSMDAGAVGQAGCTLTGVIETAAAGASDPYILGRVVRLPRIESFTLTDEKLGEATYAGVLKGENLEIIEKTGWDARVGLPVAGLPKPVLGERQKQTLRIALPWPAPSPHAPLYVWLQGEAEGRPTQARY